MKIFFSTLGVSLLMLFIAIEETFSFMPLDVDSGVILERGVISFGIYMAAWFINKLLLFPLFVRKEKYLWYLVALFGLVFVAQAFATRLQCSVVKIFAASTMLFVCFLAVSSRKFVKELKANIAKRIAAERQLIDNQVNESRLRIDSGMLDREFKTVEECAAQSPGKAIDMLYSLSRKLRSKLYGYG